MPVEDAVIVKSLVLDWRSSERSFIEIRSKTGPKTDP